MLASYTRNDMTTVLLGVLLAAAPLSAQGTIPPATPSTATSRPGTQLLMEYRPPARGVRRDGALTRSGDGVRAIVPDPGVDSLISQTIRDTPVVAVCAAGRTDSVWLRLKVGDVMNDALVHLHPGLNRIALGATKVALNDGDVAEWSLATTSGRLLLQEYIQRRVAPIAPTAKALATNGIWYDALDRFSREAAGGVPLARERLDAFVLSVGARPCDVSVDG
ncbi:MAG: hypothetical protein U5K74_15755 [Gemmatimonadaceae bacterium]|nr:hypothetical protein [Gemmatimonadaceae bacterium]